MADGPRLGRKVQALRLRHGLTQSAFAARLGVSPSYVNLVEHDRRRLSANLLIKLAEVFGVDVKAFAVSEDAQLVAELTEVFGDPLFEGDVPGAGDLREFAATTPDVARAVVWLFHAYHEARGSADSLAERVVDRQDFAGVDRARLSSEQVSDLIQRHLNHFPELEAAAEAVRAEAGHGEDTFALLARHLETKHGVGVRILKVGEMRGAVRRFVPELRELRLSEVLRRGSRSFQLAHQIGLLSCSRMLDRFAQDPQLTSDESRALCRVALANYFAGALLMPYDELLHAAREERYDIDLLGHRFRVSFEQVCHRLTTLHRRGSEGIPFHMVRIDIAGNISKKFTAIGIHFPRFSGLCPLWNVHAAFLRSGMIRVQLSRLPDGTMFFSVARTVRKHRGGHHAPNVLYAIGLGCDLESARQIVYSDGIDLANPDAAVPVGITCRLCERMDCKARAFPSLQKPLRVDENVRGESFFAPVDEQ